MKLRYNESDIKFLFEQEGVAPAEAGGAAQAVQQKTTGQKTGELSPEEMKVEQDKLQAILPKSYPDFVQALGNLINDKKFDAFLRSGLKDGDLKDDVVNYTTGDASVTALQPTQNEIDMDKSLLNILTNKFNNVGEMLTSTSVVNLGGPIVTLNKKYVIDGHHRWSQLYCANPNGKIAIFDFTIDSDASTFLKYSQLAIAAKAQSVPSKTVKGTNLMTVSKDVVIGYVVKNLSESAIKDFNEAKQISDPNQIAEFIWNNIEKMKSNNKPIEGAPSRGVMPQFGETPSGFKGVSRILKQGLVNIKPN